MKTLNLVMAFTLLVGLGSVRAGAQQNPGSSPPAVIERRALFTKAYELLPAVLEVALDMGLVNNEFQGAEFSTFDKIRAVVLEDFKSGRQDRLLFSENQDLFNLDPNQPVRTAVTSSDPKDPIYINLKIINDPAGSFALEDAMQILIHEYGHKTTDKIQSVVDAVATKIRDHIINYITHSISDTGNKMTMVAFPTMMGMGGLAKLITSQRRKSLFAMSSALLYENKSKVTDISGAWEAFLRSHGSFKILKPGLVNNTELRIWELTFNKTTKTQGTASELFTVEFMKADVASPTGQPGIATSTSATEGSEYSNIARGKAPDLRAEIAIDQTMAKVSSIFMKRVLVPQPQLKARIIHLQQLDHDRFQIGIQITTPFGFRSVKLLLEAEDGEFSVPAKAVWPGHDKLLFEVQLPHALQEKKFMVRSIVIDDLAQVILDKGIVLAAPAGKVSDGPFRLESLHFKDDMRELVPGSPEALQAEKVKLVIKLESPQDIQEIRLERRRDTKLLAPSAYTARGNPAIYGIQDIESVRFDYAIQYLDRSEFTQIRKGKYVEVTLSLKDDIYHFDLEKHSSSSRPPGKSVVGRDDGGRALTGLEIVDASLRSLRLAGHGESLSYQLMTPGIPSLAKRNQIATVSPILCRHAL